MAEIDLAAEYRHGVITVNGQEGIDLSGVEHATCDAVYQVGDNAAKLSLKCATESFRLNLASSVVDDGGILSGTWAEYGFGTSGSISGRVDGDRIGLAANVVGVDAYATKVVAFTFSALLGGCGGALFAGGFTYVSPDQFSFAESVVFLTMVLLGGSAAPAGAVLGTALLILLPEWLRFLKVIYLAVYGAAVILIMVFMPDGIWGYVHDTVLPNFNVTYKYADTSSLTLNAGAGVDTVNVLATSSPLFVNGGDSIDIINVGDSINRLDEIQGPLTVNGNSVSNVDFAIFDQSNSNTQNYTLAFSAGIGTVKRSGFSTTYTDIHSLQLNGSSGADTYTVDNTGGTPSTTVVTGVGADTVNVLATTTQLIVGNTGGKLTER